MSSKGIYLFMWGYQSHYRVHLRELTRKVLESLGAPADAEVLLVGARCPDSNDTHPICVEPEDGKWQLSLFEGLLNSIESNYQNHELQNMFYGDDASMRDKPEWIRRDSVRMSVKSALEIFDEENDVTSFCGGARRLADYYVTPVIQIPNTTLLQFPPLRPKPNGNRHQVYGSRSLIHSAINSVLHEATEELQKPEPGRSTYSRMRNEQEIVRIAAKNFLCTPGLVIEKHPVGDRLFDDLNLVSSLMYEGTKGIGMLILVDPDSDVVEFLVRFVKPIPFSEPRWVRKVLQMATTGVGIIATTTYIYGLGQLKECRDPSEQDAFTVAFIDHYHWELRSGEQVLLRSYYAVPKLPQEPFDKAAFLANYVRLFPSTTKENGLNLFSLLIAQSRQEHGSMIVIAEDAVEETSRLSKQGTNIQPTPLTKSLLQSVSGIDGTILLDPLGFCHAIGIILDGEATDQCTPSRGSRFNSAIRYVKSSGPRRLAIVVSDDRTVDIIPRVRSLVSKSKIERYVILFETSTFDNYHDYLKWLEGHRFYINAEQCLRINGTLDRIDAAPKDVGLLYFETERFEVHPEMEDSYLTD